VAIHQKSKVSYFDALNDLPDQYLFFILFLIGSVSICTLKILGFDQFTVTAVPTGLMAVYALFALVTKRYRIREDKIGDNIYYLGFLFTLVSLAYALYIFRSDGGGAESIITSFGIAIWTTIVGLAGRVFFSQMREDPVEYEREARISLAEASREMKSQLNDIAIEMSGFKRNLTQILAEGVTEISEKAKTSLEQNAEKISEVGSTITENIKSAFGTFTDHSSKLTEIASRNVKALEALFKRIERIEASPELLAAKLDPVMERFRQVADQALARSNAQNDDSKILRSVVEKAAKAAERLSETVQSTENAVRGKLEELASGVTVGVDATRELAGSLSSVTASISSELDLARSATEHARQLLQAETAATATTIAGFRTAAASEAEATRAIVESLRVSATEIVSAHKRVVDEARAALTADLDQSRRHHTEIRQALEQSRSMLVQMEEALVSLSNTIVKRLNGP